MKSIQGYIDGLKEKNRILTQLVDEIAACAEDKANAEYSFEVAYARKIMELRADGMPATIMSKVVSGDKLVADLKLKAEIAKGIYEAKKAAIKATHVSIDTYRSLLSFEKEEFKRTFAGTD